MEFEGKGQQTNEKKIKNMKIIRVKGIRPDNAKRVTETQVIKQSNKETNEKKNENLRLLWIEKKIMSTDDEHTDNRQRRDDLDAASDIF